MLKSILTILFLLLISNSITVANPGGVGGNRSLRPVCASCHSLDFSDNERDALRVAINSLNFTSGEFAEIEIYSNSGNNAVRGVFLLILDKNYKNINISNEKLLIPYLKNPVELGFELYNNMGEKINTNYKEQFYLYRTKPVNFRMQIPYIEQERRFTFFVIVAYGKGSQLKEITNTKGAKYIISPPIEINVEPSIANISNLDRSLGEKLVSSSEIEKIKESFFNVEQISNIINMHFIAFIFLTITLLLFISEKFYFKKLDKIYSNIESDKFNSLSISYNFIKYTSLFISLIFIFINLLNRSVWVSLLDKYLIFYNILLLIGFIIVIIFAIIIMINPLKLKLGNYFNYISLIILIFGYIIYSIGFYNLI